MFLSRLLRVGTTVCAWAVMLVTMTPPMHAEDPPNGVTQLLPRNRIASIDAPVFVDAAHADIPDDAWVLGVELDGQARAYSLNVLNHHEIVNDQVGEKPFAAVW